MALPVILEAMRLRRLRRIGLLLATEAPLVYTARCRELPPPILFKNIREFFPASTTGAQHGDAG